MSVGGVVYLVGAGPGDAGLLTLRGKELLERAEVVIYDGLVSRELLRFVPPSAKIIYGGKHDRTRCVSQAELNALLLSKARGGKQVVRLKGGDPFVFGRGGEEAEALAAAGIPFEVVPGVSSVYSVPACAGIPLTPHASRLTPHASVCVTVVTGHDGPLSSANKVDWTGLAKLPGTLVVLMGLKNIEAIAAALIAHGRSADTPAAIVSHGTTGRQQTVVGTLDTITELARNAAIRPPAVTVIGDVVRLRERLNWFEQRPLFGRRVVVTQRADLARPLVATLRNRGAEVLEVPSTRWVPHPGKGQAAQATGEISVNGEGRRTPNIQYGQAELEEALARLDSYDWILFSNPIGAEFFFERFFQIHGDLRQLGRAKLGAYGPRTGRKLRELHLQPAAVAADHKTPLILDAIMRCGSVNRQRFLILRGDSAYERVPEALTELGAMVDVVPVYAVAPETEDSMGGAALLVEEGADWLIFASGLAIEHFHQRFNLPALLARFPAMRLAIASPTIQWALDRLALTPAAIGKPDDAEVLVNAIVETEAVGGDVGTTGTQSWQFREPVSLEAYGG